LYEITGKHVHEIGKKQIFKFLFKKTQKFQKTLKRKKKDLFFFQYLKIQVKLCLNMLVARFLTHQEHLDLKTPNIKEKT
jgi:hypothetical protein